MKVLGERGIRYRGNRENRGNRVDRVYKVDKGKPFSLSRIHSFKLLIFESLGF
jgi:hypothetical protein